MHVSLAEDNAKLERTASFPESSNNSQATVLEQQNYDNCRNDGLYRRFSCEQILDPSSNIRHMKVSHTLSSFRKKNDLTFSIGPTITTTKNIWLPAPLSSTNTCNQQNNDINANGCKTKLCEKSFSCNDIPRNCLETSLRQLNLSNKKKTIFTVPALPPPPPSPPPSPPPTPPKVLDDNLIQENIKPSINLVLPSENKNGTSGQLQHSSRYNSSLHLTNLNNRKLSSTFCKSIFSIIFLSILVSWFSMVVKEDDLVSLCSPVINFSSTTVELQKHIYGQNRALQKLTEYFGSQKAGFQVVNIVGGTGVGKSYTANIIKEHLKSEYSSIEYVPPMLGKDKVTYNNLSACKCNLIIIESVLQTDINDVVKFCKDLKIRATSYCILVLVLINTQEVTENLDKVLDVKEGSELVNFAFQKEDLDIVTIEYNSLEIDILDHCILEAAEYCNVTLTSDDIKQIRQHLLEFQSGCKGAYAQVQVLGKD